MAELLRPQAMEPLRDAARAERLPTAAWSELVDAVLSLAEFHHEGRPKLTNDKTMVRQLDQVVEHAHALEKSIAALGQPAALYFNDGVFRLGGEPSGTASSVFKHDGDWDPRYIIAALEAARLAAAAAEIAVAERREEGISPASQVVVLPIYAERLVIFAMRMNRCGVDLEKRGVLVRLCDAAFVAAGIQQGTEGALTYAKQHYRGFPYGGKDLDIPAESWIPYS